MKNIKFLTLLFASALTFNSCVVEDDEPRAENLANTPLSVGFSKSLETASYFEDIGAVENDYYAEIKGGLKGFSNQEFSVAFEVDPSSTATEGIEFNFVGSKTITFSPNRDLASFKLNVNTGSLNPTQATELVLNLTNTDQLLVPESSKTMRIAFVGCVSQITEGIYSYTQVGGNGGPASGTTPIDMSATNTFEMNFPGVSAGGNPLKMTIGDICGDLSILGSELEAYGITVEADSIDFDPNTDTIIFTNLRGTGNGYNFQRGTVTYILN